MQQPKNIHPGQWEIINETARPVIIDAPKFDYQFPPDGPSDSLLQAAEHDFDVRCHDHQQFVRFQMQHTYPCPNVKDGIVDAEGLVFVPQQRMPNNKNSVWVTPAKRDGEYVLIADWETRLVIALAEAGADVVREEQHDIDVSLLNDKIPERILCAAIWFNDGKEYHGQPKNIATGFVITGRRHHNCYAILSAIGKVLGVEGIAKNQFERIDRDHQGFITSSDRYVDRKEGLQIAMENQQIWHNTLGLGDILISEDLY